MAINQEEVFPQDAKLLAQYVAMAPFIFQTAVCLRDFGILKVLQDHPEGLTLSQLEKQFKLTKYSLSVLLDAGLSAKILNSNKAYADSGKEKNDEDEKFTLTQMGAYLENDELTRINMNFTQDVCYRGLFHLREALETNTPAGLKELGSWSTIYEGLTQLPADVQKSWFDFDHFYSDHSFPRALPHIFKNNPKKIMDVGANTGKFATACLQYSDTVQMTLLDHPAQLKKAEENLSRLGLKNRAQFFPMNLLDHAKPFPEGQDVVWMSQFLSCFGDDDVVNLLKRGRCALNKNGELIIMETLTDSQRFQASRFCLDMTSLYFTVMANGQSRMYRANDFLNLIRQAGLQVVETIPNLRLSHTIIRCVAG